MAVPDEEVGEAHRAGSGDVSYLEFFHGRYEKLMPRKRPVEEVALERYGNIDEYNEALEERRVLDERDSRRLSRRGTSNSDVGGPSTPSTAGMRTPGGEASTRRYMFTNTSEDLSRPGSRAGFRRPGEAGGGAEGLSTPTTAGAGRVDQLRRNGSTAQIPKVSTPIPSVFTPQAALQRSGSGYPFDLPAGQALEPDRPALTLEQLNRLQAKVLRAKLMEDDNAAELEEEYEYERLRYEGTQGGGDAGGERGIRRMEGGKEVQTEVLPTLDGAGRLYDVGSGGGGVEEAEERRPGNRRKKVEKVSPCSLRCSKAGRGELIFSLKHETSKATSSDIMQTTMIRPSASWFGKNASALGRPSRRVWMRPWRARSLGTQNIR